jgi:hypothetical protein
VLEFERLEKFGRLAQNDFSRMPRIAKVKKSMQSEYEKRLVFADGSTLPHCVPDPVMRWLNKDEKKKRARKRAKIRRDEKRAEQAKKMRRTGTGD